MRRSTPVPAWSWRVAFAAAPERRELRVPLVPAHDIVERQPVGILGEAGAATAMRAVPAVHELRAQPEHRDERMQRRGGFEVLLALDRGLPSAPIANSAIAIQTIGFSSSE